MNEEVPFLRAQDDGTSLHVRVVPRASRNEIAGIVGDRLKMRIAAPPVDSAANDELVDFLAGQLGVARSAIQLVRGRTSRNKTLLVRGLSPQAIAASLEGRL
jgi:uncharacterized protein (TIGR00251 family)